jgi:hypothetical protein
MTNRTHTVVHMSVGTGLLVSGLVAIVGAAIMMAGLFVETPETETPRRILPRIGNVQPAPESSALGNAAAAEATYGPVNKAALNEAKQGIVSRIVHRVRSRRASRYVQSCPCPQPQTAQPQQTTQTWRVVTEPVYRVPRQPTVTPMQPLNAEPNDCIPCQRGLQVKPSVDPASTQKLRSDILESTFGPVNKSALSETKSNSPTLLSRSERRLNEPAKPSSALSRSERRLLDPADVKPSLPADFSEVEPTDDSPHSRSDGLSLPRLPPLPEAEQIPAAPVDWVPRMASASDVPEPSLPIRPSVDPNVGLRVEQRTLNIRPSR